MAFHNDTGKKGEQLASEWMLQKGFRLIEKNWRYRHCEIDIIATKNDTLHFIEVKTRRSQRFGLPEQSVSLKKMERMTRAAAEYLRQQPQWKRVQYDIISIEIVDRNEPRFFLIEDVFIYPI